MSEAMGADLSGVRVHVGDEAHRLARSVQSVAFTYGNDIYLSRDAGRPGDHSGDAVLAHELAHVAQGPGSGSGTIGRADDEVERDADRRAARAFPALRRHPVTMPATDDGRSADLDASRTQRAAPASIRRATIKLNQLSKFLQLDPAKQQRMLETQSPGHLQRLTDLLEDRKRTSSEDESSKINYVLGLIPDIMLAKQESDVKRLGRGANWANATLYVDGRMVASEQSTKSGLASGSKLTRWGTAGKGRKRSEILISHNDSEATVFANLSKNIDTTRIAAATTSIELVFVSTNGACNGCKGRINEFVNQMLLPHAEKGVWVRMRYRYAPKPGTKFRGVKTEYGWPGDVEYKSLYEHQTVYRGAPGATTLPDVIPPSMPDTDEEEGD